MTHLYTEIEINAPRHLVWQALIRKERWVYWNTFLYDLDARIPLEEGRELWLSFRRVSGETETEFQPRVVLVQSETCLHWVSEAPGLRNEQVFQLQDAGWERTKYYHQQIFSGWLNRVSLPFIRQDEQRGMSRMARELKKYAESYPQALSERVTTGRRGRVRSLQSR